MENRVLTPEEEKELLEKAGEVPTNIRGAEVQSNEQELEFNNPAEARTPAKGIEREDSEIGE